MHRLTGPLLLGLALIVAGCPKKRAVDEPEIETEEPEIPDGPRGPRGPEGPGGPDIPQD